MDRERSFKSRRPSSDRNDEGRGYGNRDGNRSFGDRNNSRSFGNRDNDGGFKREMHKAVCAECGNECTVPFKPVQDKPVYCRDCFMKRKKF